MPLLVARAYLLEAEKGDQTGMVLVESLDVPDVEAHKHLVD